MNRSIASLAALLALGACGTETPTEAVAVNGYAAPSAGNGASAITLYRVWYSTTLFRDAVAPGEASEPERAVPGGATAYAVLAVGAPPSFIPVKSMHELKVARGDTLRVVVSDRTFAGRCGGSRPLTQEDADFVTQRVFPAEFAGEEYDAATCTSFPSTSVDGGGAMDAALPGRDAAAPASADAALP